MTARADNQPRPIATLRHHVVAVNTAEFSSCFGIDHHFLMSGDVSGKVALWNVDRRRVVSEFQPHNQDAILKIQDFDIGNNLILSQGRDGKVSLWDTTRIDQSPRRSTSNNMKENVPSNVSTFTTGSYNFCKCASLRWNNAAASARRSAVNDTGATGRNASADITRNEPPPDPITEPNEEGLESEVDPQGSGVVNLTNGVQIQRPGNSGTNQGCEHLIVAPCADSSTVGIWDVRNLKNSRPCLTFFDDKNGENKAKDKTGMLMCLRFTEQSNAETKSTASAEQPIVIAGYESGGIALFDVRAAKERSYLKVHSEPLLSFDVDRVCNQIVSSAADSTLQITSLNILDDKAPFTQTKVASSENPEAASLSSLTVTQSVFSTNGQRLFLPSRSEIRLEKPGVDAVALRPHQDIFATAGWDRRVRIYEWGYPHRQLAILKHHTAGVCSVSWSSDSALLATASKDGNIAVWSLFPPK